MIALRPIVVTDAATLAGWGMDHRFRTAAGWSDRSRDGYLQFHTEHITRLPDDEVMLAITDADRVVGYVCCYLDRAGGCELGIVIGPSANWSRGYGRRALALATRYAARTLRSTWVWAETHPANTAAQRMLRAAGFAPSGERGAVEDYCGELAAMIRFEPEPAALSAAGFSPRPPAPA